MTVRTKYFDPALLINSPWLDYQSHLTVDIIYDLLDSRSVPDREILAGQETENVANEIALALESVGHQAKLWPITNRNYQSVINQLTGDIVFNQVESDILGYNALLYIEQKHLKVTGTGSSGYRLSWNKAKIQDILINAGISTPKYKIIKRNNKFCLPNKLKYPQIVKSANDHGSLSINQKSVVRNLPELNSQVNWIFKEQKDDALIEDYIAGRELSLTFIGNEHELLFLPVKEILFGPMYPGKANIVTYDSKWVENSIDYQSTLKLSCPANLDEMELHNIQKTVSLAIKYLSARDYGRFDIRLRDKIPYIIDYNANPALGYDAASRIPAEVFGLAYPAFINAIVLAAMNRYPDIK
jgi:D-alanine-D-alanine ligase